MREYYRSVFPHEQLYAWLQAPTRGYWREFSASFNDKFSRHRTAYCAEDLRALVLQDPERVDVGAWWAQPPLHHNAQTNVVVGRELTVDFDQWPSPCAACVRGKCKTICAHCYAHLLVPSVQRFAEYLRWLHMPEPTAIFTGSRSIHLWYRLDLPDTHRVRLLYEASRATNVLVDVAVCKVSHLIRMPYMVNAKSRVAVAIDLGNPGDTPFVYEHQHERVRNSFKYLCV